MTLSQNLLVFQKKIGPVTSVWTCERFMGLNCQLDVFFESFLQHFCFFKTCLYKLSSTSFAQACFYFTHKIVCCDKKLQKFLVRLLTISSITFFTLIFPLIIVWLASCWQQCKKLRKLENNGISFVTNFFPFFSMWNLRPVAFSLVSLCLLICKNDSYLQIDLIE